jgi:endonuclease-3
LTRDEAGAVEHAWLDEVAMSAPLEPSTCAHPEPVQELAARSGQALSTDAVFRVQSPDVTRIERLLVKLQTFYGKLPSPPSDPFTLFVWEVLSVHAAPRKRDAAFGALKKARALTPDAMWRAPQATLESSVAIAGPFREQRLRSLRIGVELFRGSPALPKAIKGPVSAALKALKPLPRMGEGGAYRMLLFAAGHAVLPVDARVSRVARRLGYGEQARDFTRTARSVRQAVAIELAPDATAYQPLYLYLTHHGATTCTEADPHCAVCPLLTECPEGEKRLGRSV